jgi:hypothetical protein
MKKNKLTGIKERFFFINCSCKTSKQSNIRQEDFKINSTFISDFLVYLGILRDNKSDSSIYRILILDFYYLLLSLWFIITDANLLNRWSRNSQSRLRLVQESQNRSDRSVTQWKPALWHQHYWNEVEGHHEAI